MMLMMTRSSNIFPVAKIYLRVEAKAWEKVETPHPYRSRGKWHGSLPALWRIKKIWSMENRT